MDPETGLCIFPTRLLSKPVIELITAYEETAARTFHPDRENDQLTRALGKKEHPGHARGTGGMTWKDGFASGATLTDGATEKKKSVQSG